MATPPNTDTFFPSKFYHLYNHAVGKDNLFHNSNNYSYFLLKFKHHISPICKVYAYCLMPNHFHFLIEVRSESELVDFYKLKKKIVEVDNIDYHKIVMQQFSNLFSGYAQAYNKMFDRKGALFIDYVRRKEINDERYFTTVINYIHNNPIHHNFCKTIDDWTYSSYHSITSKKQTNLERDKVIEWFGGEENYINQHKKSKDYIAEFEC